MTERNERVEALLRPVVTVDPAVRFGRPAINGVSTEVIADLYWAGEAADDVADEYGLTRHALLTALWFEGTHGEYRKRWQRWADKVAYPRLAGWKTLDVDTMPLPADKDGDRE